MDRPVEFYRDRHMRHDHCGHTCTVDLEWYERYVVDSDDAPGCPGCGAKADYDDALQFIGDPTDPALDDQFTLEVTWFHTSTHEDWPSPFDWGTWLTDDTRRAMGEESAARWVERRNRKDLHIGTYEAAVHNMLRRIDSQGDDGKQFYLYAVRLRPDVVILPGSMIDPSRDWGDVWIDEIASPEIDVVRYVNVHEDPGGLSAVVRSSAIAAVQRLPIPLPAAHDDAWVADTAARLTATSPEPIPPPADAGAFPYLYRETHRAKAARDLATLLAAGLPAAMVREFESAVRWVDGDDPAEWARYARSLASLVGDAERVLGELAEQPVRKL